MSEQTEREKLIKELVEIYHDTNYPTRMHLIEAMAEFVIQDRRRIIDPLKSCDHGDYNYQLMKAIEQTLSNAGVL